MPAQKKPRPWIAHNRAHGIKVACVKGLWLGTNEEIGRQRPDGATNLAREARTAKTDSIFVSCANCKTSGIIVLNC